MYFYTGYLLSLDEDCSVSAPIKSQDCCRYKPGDCGENQGGCSRNYDCKDGLKCSYRNWPEGFPSDFHLF